MRDGEEGGAKTRGGEEVGLRDVEEGGATRGGELDLGFDMGAVKNYG